MRWVSMSNVIFEFTTCSCRGVDEYESHYTQEEWAAMSEEEQEQVMNEEYAEQRQNSDVGGLWVKGTK